MERYPRVRISNRCLFSSSIQVIPLGVYPADVGRTQVQRPLAQPARSEPGFLRLPPLPFFLLPPPHRLLLWPGLPTNCTAPAFALNRSFPVAKRNHECCPATKEQMVTQTQRRRPTQDSALTETELPPTHMGQRRGSDVPPSGPSGLCGPWVGRKRRTRCIRL